MRKLIKKVVLALCPPVRHLIEQRNQLLLQIQEAVSTQSFERNSHRLYTTLNVDPAISVGSSVNDDRIIERLLKSYQRSSSDEYGSDSMWREFFNTHHQESHKVFMQGDVEKARQILANPGSSNLFYGFDELCVQFLPGYHADPGRLARSCQDSLLRLAEAIGAFRIECPEFTPTRWLQNTAISTDEILQAIEAKVGKDISFPDIYPGAVGANSRRGIVTYRAIQALYLAFRLRQIVQDGLDPPNRSICEIGAGLARSALYASRLGLRDYTLVDVPITAISQGYYLMRCLGEDAVVLPGEPRRSREQIRIMHPEELFSSEEHFALIANVDSLSELGHDVAVRYLKKISDIAPSFLSINHESNSIRVIDMLKELDRPYKISRFPYWMRQGYVEEFVRFK